MHNNETTPLRTDSLIGDFTKASEIWISESKAKLETREGVWQEEGGWRLPSKIGGRWDWREVDPHTGGSWEVETPATPSLTAANL